MNKEEIKNELLFIIQKDFPLTKRPFLEISKRLGITEDEVINILKEEKEKSIIRQISPIFDTKKLGYKSSLVAFEVDEKNLEKVAKIINAHPGVSHNYQRDHKFNLWFTIAVAPDSKIGLEKTVEILFENTKARDYVLLPTLKMFKIQVKLDTTGKSQKREKVENKVFKNLELNNFYKKIIEKSQKDLPITKEPFLDTIKEIGIGYEEFFQALQDLKDAGMMRRFAAILNHKKAGFNTNAMVVWDVDENKATEIGKKAASFSAVSHCYLRPKYEKWPYNLFTMIHAKSEDEIQNIIDEISNEIEYKNKRPLYSLREFKKQRILYYSKDFYKWEEKYA